jgi:hypothetical protein
MEGARVNLLTAISRFVERARADWDGVRLSELVFGEKDAALLAMFALAAVATVVLVARSAATRTPGRGSVVLPAVLGQWAGSWVPTLRHLPLILMLAGVPLFAIALSDPATPLSRREVTRPGRRISLMIDGSSSMLAPFAARTLTTKDAPMEATFFTSVAAAERFVRLRMSGGYNDLVSLIEFADTAYVITPFTTDYDNILLSLALIGNMGEWENFPDRGTVIAQAVEQAVSLFRAFDFLDASGNLMVIFTDGADADVLENGKTVDDVLAEAQKSHIPVYLIKIGGNIQQKRSVADDLWIGAVKKTGGEFFSGGDEATIIRAIQAIDRRAAGKIEMKQYSTERPRYAPFALTAALLWCAALVLRFTIPTFQTFP